MSPLPRSPLGLPSVVGEAQRPSIRHEELRRTRRLESGGHHGSSVVPHMASSSPRPRRRYCGRSRGRAEAASSSPAQICSSSAACSSSPLSALDLLLPRDRPGAPPPPHGAAARHALPPHGLGVARNSRRSADLTACPHSAGRHARLGRRRPAHLNE
jgi:hypothetical protein